MLNGYNLNIFFIKIFMKTFKYKFDFYIIMNKKNKIKKKSDKIKWINI